ncbi:MAG: DUF4292 domain-containing protein [Thermodesulfobacteriota bacterium]
MPGVKSQDPVEMEARSLLSGFEAKNNGLESFKGIATVRYLENGVLRKARVAWIGVIPDKLRMAAMAPSGHPLVSFSDDGVSLYLLSYPDDRFHQGKSNTSLKQFLSVPISTRELISVLCGRIPLQNPSGRVLIHREENGYVMETKTPWNSGSKKFFLDKEKKDILKFESIDSEGIMEYRVEWDRFQEIKGFFLPYFISIRDREGLVLEIDAGEVWVNPAVDPDAFVLKPGAGFIR